MPYIAFASNFLWVMVIGLLGPSIPAIVEDLKITYAQAGLFFTLLSLGSLFGTSLGAIASDYLNRKLFLSLFTIALGVGLLCLGLAPSFLVISLVIFLLSLAGSPIGAIGQSILLDMFSTKREKYLSMQTFYAALGSFIAPLLISLNLSFKMSWRWPFIETALLCGLLCGAILFSFIPASRARTAQFRKLSAIIGNPTVIKTGLLIFFSVGIDLGFSYWLAEYFKTELHVAIRLASASVSLYLIGVISGRFLVARLLASIESNQIIIVGLGLALG
ncbi:MAG: MFS transporter, partial [Spirochaetota bacterium]